MRAVHMHLMIVVELNQAGATLENYGQITRPFTNNPACFGGARRANDGQQGVAASAAARGHRVRAPRCDRRRCRAVRKLPGWRPNAYRFAGAVGAFTA